MQVTTCIEKLAGREIELLHMIAVGCVGMIVREYSNPERLYVCDVMYVG